MAKDNQVTGTGPETDASKIVEKQRKRHYEPEMTEIPNEANEKRKSATDDGNLRAQDVENEEYIPNDSYPISEAEAQKKPKKKAEPVPLPWE